MFDICIEFLQGRVVAASPTDPSQLEWPIEPARFFMAMVATHHECGFGEENLEMLRWFESLDPPTIDQPKVFPRQVRTTFVVVNDSFGTKENPLARSKQPRTFASGFVGDAVTRYRYSAEIPKAFQPAIQQTLDNVVRIGHSSSLVRCWLDDASAGRRDRTNGEVEQASSNWSRRSWAPADHVGRDLSTTYRRMRTVRRGTLGVLDRCANQSAIDDYDQLAKAVTFAPNAKQSRLAKQELKRQFPNGSPSTQPIRIGTHTLYAQSHQTTVGISDELSTEFDPGLIVLSVLEGNRVGLESTLQLCQAFRGAVLSSHDTAAPEWVSGHGADGSAAAQTHLAYVPLAHVGTETEVDITSPAASDPQNIAISGPRRRPATSRQIYDGHLLGLAIAMPRGISASEKSDHLSQVLFDPLGEPREIELRLGRLGTMTLLRESRHRPPRSLHVATWTRPSDLWATVTPIVLDRHPKADRRREPERWREEVTESIRRSCGHVGIDTARIKGIRVGSHGFIAGVPSARPGRGFPLMKRSSGTGQPIQVHAVIQFDSKVSGPLLLGAGRFRGYGFCKPVEVRR